MGVNLVPIVRKFSITTETFPTDHADVVHGCAPAGTHRLLRFDSLLHNVGETDLTIGAPADHPELFVFHPAPDHNHYHVKDMTEFALFDVDGVEVTAGVKLSMALADIEHRSPGGSAYAQFNSDFQGISAGWADLYHAHISCQYLVIDGVADGAYTLVATADPLGLVAEDTTDDNTACVGLLIAGHTVTEIVPPMKVTLLTPEIVFADVTPGEMGVAEAVFSIRSCRPVTIQITNGPYPKDRGGDPVIGLPEGFSLSLGPANSVAERFVHFPFSYLGTTSGDVLTNGGVAFRSLDGDDEWPYVKITAKTI